LRSVFISQSDQFYGTAVFVFQNLLEKVFVKKPLLALENFKMGLGFMKGGFLHLYVWAAV